MEIEDEIQNMKIEINDHIRSSNSLANNVSGSKKSQNDQNKSKDLAKFNEFMLTPLESLILNKKMPKGFKFELEENILKSFEHSKNNQRRIKPKESNQEPKGHEKPIRSPINEDKKNLAEKEHSSKGTKKQKKLEKENSKNILNKNSNSNNNINKIEGNNSEAYKVRIKCTSGFNKIKSGPGANLFYVSKIIDAPSLSKIENKINNFEYKTLKECFDDIRKLWNYQFKSHAKEPSIYQNICKLSSLTENVFKELLNEKNTFNEKKEEISNIKKRTEKVKKELEEITGNSQKDLSNKNIKAKNTTAINKLSEMIRILNKQQLRGIIPIIWDKNEMTNKKSYEFDLDKLPEDKFKKLEIYVVNCFNENKNTNIINKNISMYNQNLKKNNGIKKNGIANNNLSNKNNNINHQNGLKKEENKKINNSFSDSDSLSSNSSL